MLTAKCPDGKLRMRAKALFPETATGKAASAWANILRNCGGTG